MTGLSRPSADIIVQGLVGAGWASIVAERRTPDANPATRLAAMDTAITDCLAGAGMVADDLWAITVGVTGRTTLLTPLPGSLGASRLALDEVDHRRSGSGLAAPLPPRRPQMTCAEPWSWPPAPQWRSSATSRGGRA